VAQETPAIGPIVDGNVHLWDQRDNPVFWLSDRTLLRDMLGDYDSLPDRHTLSDYRREAAGYDVRGVIWSDAGSIRMRLVAGLSGRAAGGDVLDDQLVRDNLTLLEGSGLVATVEATSSQLGMVTRLAAEFPALKIVIDHFGWPEAGPDGADRARHMRDLAGLAAAGNVATRSTPSVPSSATGPCLSCAPGCSMSPASSARSGACSARTCRSRTCGPGSDRYTTPTTPSSLVSPVMSGPGCSTGQGRGVAIPA